MTASKLDESSLKSIKGDWSQNLVDTSMYQYKSCGTMKPVGICLHNTANSAPATNEISYMRTNTNKVSYHMAIDDKQAIMGLPFDRRAYHAGDGGGPGNASHIGIEIAQSTNYSGDIFDKAEKRAAVVVAKICQQYGWGTSQIKAHRDFSGKDCPHRTKMPEFLSMVQQVLNGGSADSTTTNKTDGGSKPAEKPQSSSSGISVGSKVKVTGSKYATGQTVPGWVKANTYTVTQISNGRALLSDIISWVNLGDLALQGGGSKPQTTTSKPASTGGTQTQSDSGLSGLLASHPNVTTNQDLINLFYSMGGNNFNGAGQVAKKYGVNINDLCNNRQGKVDRSTASASTSKPASTTSQPKTQSETAGYVSGTGGSGLNVRSGAGTGHSRIGGLAEGAAVIIVGEQSGWYIIKYSGGKGYVSSQYIKKGSKPASQPSGNSQSGSSSSGGWKWPSTATYISSGYGYRGSFTCTNGTQTSDFHGGIDIAGGGSATIKATKAGTATYMGNNGGYGNWVQIDHGNGQYSRYAHMRATELSSGPRHLNAGDKVGDEGATGNVTGPHLHFEILIGGSGSGNRVNPLDYVKP